MNTTAITVITTNSSLLLSNGTNLLSLLSRDRKDFSSALLSNGSEFPKISQAEIRKIIIVNKEYESKVRIGEILKIMGNSVTLHCE